ncbi:MAG: DUF2076 domain-containing protein, partial [Acetobacteraceae bacterium]|nr:DUF2076 domain-containing protein [Acetobacteraceae bacterium]
MTDEERQIITAFIARMGGEPQPAAPGRPPATGGQPLPPVDPEADRLIQELFQRYPEARYRITQAAFVQEHALREAQNRIQDLEWQVQAAEARAEAQQRRGFFGFGAPRQPDLPPRPTPLPPGPGAQAMAASQGRPGFLGGALATAAGVAGGILLGNALMSLFSGSGAAQAAAPAAETAADSPWTNPAAAAEKQYGTEPDQMEKTQMEKTGWDDPGYAEDGGDAGGEE